MAGSVKLEIDKKTFDHIQKQIQLAGDGGKASAYRALVKVLFKIQAEAKLRLIGRGHVVTSRLANSIYVKTQKPTLRRGNQLTYSDKKGNTYSSELETVNVSEFEGAVGTNVEYAQDIEMGSNPHTIEPVNASALSWLPSAKGKAWFTSKTKSSLKSYYSDKEGNNTLKRNRIFAKRVKHPGFKGDSFLYWALKHVNILRSMKDDMKDDLKYGKFLKKQSIYEVKGKALTSSDL